MNWGLLSSEDDLPMLRLQPVFPYFLRTRLADPARSAQKAAIERAFRAHYDGMEGVKANSISSSSNLSRIIWVRSHQCSNCR